MPTVNVLDTSGKPSGTLDLKSEVFGVEVRVPLLHQAVTRERGQWSGRELCCGFDGLREGEGFFQRGVDSQLGGELQRILRLAASSA